MVVVQPLGSTAAGGTMLHVSPPVSLWSSPLTSASHSRLPDPAARALGSSSVIDLEAGGAVRLGATATVLQVVPALVVRKRPLVLLPAAAPPMHSSQNVCGAAAVSHPPSVHGCRSHIGSGRTRQ